MRAREFIKRLWGDDRGQSTTEYILILSIVVMIAMKFKSAFKDRLISAADSVGSQIDATIRDSQN